MTDLPEKYHAEVVEQFEELAKLIHSKGQTILNGLADRPKPGDKAKARDAAKAIIFASHELWKFMEGKKPLVVTNGNEEATFFDLYLVGLAKADEVDDYIDQWYRGFDAILLHDFLGMTRDEYGKFMIDPAILPQLRKDRLRPP